MRISVFAGILNDPWRPRAIKDAVAVAAGHGAKLLVLPGWSLGRWDGTGEVSPRGKIGRAREKKRSQQSDDLAATIQQLADDHNLSILTETATTGTTWCFRPHQATLGPFVQRFASSNEATRDAVQDVNDLLESDQRTVVIEGKRINVLLCGENNILRNVRELGNAPQPRHDGIGWAFSYDVLVNPAHSSMGQWNLLHERFAYFSQGGRTAIHCTNNTHAAWGTAMCVYQDGRKLAMGDLKVGNELPHRMEPNWRLVTISI